MKFSKYLVLASMIFAGSAFAQFNRVEDKAAVSLSYAYSSPSIGRDWQGAELAVSAPIVKAPVRVTGDVSLSTLHTNLNKNSIDNAVSAFGVGVTGSTDVKFFKGFIVTPYTRFGLVSNSGNLYNEAHRYVSYSVEPGVIVKSGSLYSLLGYEFGNGFSNDFGSQIRTTKLGVGVQFVKNVSLEVRQEFNRGDVDTNRTVATLRYQF